MKKTLSMQKRYGYILLTGLLVGTLLPGCGKPKGSVSGQVTFNGTPLKSGFVTFLPEKGAAVDSPIDSEGKYSVKNVPVGKAKISIRSQAGTSQEAFSQIKDPKNPKEMMQALKPKPSGQMLPQNYNDPDKSGLTFEVKQGPQEHNIELK